MLEVNLDGVMYDALKRPVVILRYQERVLPILIGQHEAFAIANALEKVEVPRPMTHDLITYILRGFQSSLECIQVYKLEGGTFYAYLILSQNEDGSEESNIIKIDCRPSDAIAIALRMNSPIFVAEEVMQVAGQETVIEEEEED